MKKTFARAFRLLLAEARGLFGELGGDRRAALLICGAFLITLFLLLSFSFNPARGLRLGPDVMRLLLLRLSCLVSLSFFSAALLFPGPKRMRRFDGGALPLRRASIVASDNFLASLVYLSCGLLLVPVIIRAFGLSWSDARGYCVAMLAAMGAFAGMATMHVCSALSVHLTGRACPTAPLAGAVLFVWLSGALTAVSGGLDGLADALPLATGTPSTQLVILLLLMLAGVFTVMLVTMPAISDLPLKPASEARRGTLLPIMTASAGSRLVTLSAAFALSESGQATVLAVFPFASLLAALFVRSSNEPTSAVFFDICSAFLLVLIGGSLIMASLGERALDAFTFSLPLQRRSAPIAKASFLFGLAFASCLTARLIGLRVSGIVSLNEAGFFCSAGIWLASAVLVSSFIERHRSGTLSDILRFSCLAPTGMVAESISGVASGLLRWPLASAFAILALFSYAFMESRHAA